MSVTDGPGASLPDPDDNRGSVGTKRQKHASILLRVTAAILFILGLAWAVFFVTGSVLEGVPDANGIALFATVLTVLLGAGATLSVIAQKRERNILARAREASRNRASVSLRHAEEQVIVRSDVGESEADITFAKLWFATQRRIDYYHEIATEQSRHSFRNGQISAYLGFAVVIGVAVIAAFTSSSTGAIAASVIGVAGAGLSAYIGSTFMKAQSDAAAQLRQYFLQPVEFSLMLGAERLVKAIEDPVERSKAVQEIVRNTAAHHSSSKDS
jgi:hypothetical protein